MKHVVDGRTQVKLVALKVEARQLKEYLARRAAAERRRLRGPVEAQRDRIALLETGTGALETEVASLERGVASLEHDAWWRSDGLRGLAWALAAGGAALSWMLGAALLVTNARLDDPMLGVLVLAPALVVTFARRRS